MDKEVEAKPLMVKVVQEEKKEEEFQEAPEYQEKINIDELLEDEDYE